MSDRAVGAASRGARLRASHLHRVVGARAGLCASLALADDPAFAGGLVAECAFPVKGACYGRAYDRAHLDRQMGQVVAGIL